MRAIVHHQVLGNLSDGHATLSTASTEFIQNEILACSGNQQTPSVSSSITAMQSASAPVNNGSFFESS
jgi:hypothetical protein